MVYLPDPVQLKFRGTIFRLLVKAKTSSGQTGRPYISVTVSSEEVSSETEHHDWKSSVSDRQKLHSMYVNDVIFKKLFISLILICYCLVLLFKLLNSPICLKLLCTFLKQVFRSFYTATEGTDTHDVPAWWALTV